MVANGHAPNGDLTKLNGRYFDKFATEDLRVLRSRIDGMIQDRARQFDLFCVPMPEEAPAPARAVTQARADFGQVLSPTQVSTWYRCSAKWYYRYALGLPAKRGANLVLGSAVHRTLERNFKSKLQTGADMLIEAAQHQFVEDLEAELAGKDVALEADETPEELQRVGLGLVSLYMAKAAPQIDPAAIELRCVGEIAGVTVQGQIDLIDTRGVIHDLKTKARKPSGVDADYALQIATYRKICPTASGDASLQTLVKTKTPQLVQLNYKVSESDLRQADVLYPLAKEGMNSGLYFPNRNDFLCSRKYCPYWERCEADFGGRVSGKDGAE